MASLTLPKGPRLAAWLLVSALLGAQAGPAPVIQEAQAQIQGGRFDAARKLLVDLTQTAPDNLGAWRLLAFCDLKVKDHPGAIAAYGKVLVLSPSDPVALYNTGVAYALQGEPDEAFRYLAQAKRTHRVDMSQAETDEDLASLRTDPRFEDLQPKPEDFTRPFVEPVKILREFDGEGPNDQFGWIARDIGDVDGDGVHDFVTSAPSKAIPPTKEGAAAGRVYVSTGRNKLLWSVDGQPGDGLGTGIEAAGDTDRDGIPDVVAGAPGGPETVGKAYLYSGRDGRLLRSFNGTEKGDSFGQHVSTAGDLDQDGYADVIVGAPGSGRNAGKAFVYSGRDGRLLLTLEGEMPGDRFGSTVAGHAWGDHTFLIVGAPGAGPAHTGRVYVYDSRSGRPKFTLESDETGKALGGMFVSCLGDVDGDGVPDIYASDWNNSAKGRSTGRVYVLSGKDGHRLFTFTGDTAGEGFGTCAAVVGDVDGDGHADLIVGAWQFAGAAISGGKAYLYSGKDGRLLKTYTCRIPGDTLGFDAVGIGDVDGDGEVDLLLTSAWSAIHGFQSGRVFVVSSGVRPAKEKPAP